MEKLLNIKNAKAAMAAKGFTQTALAAELGVSKEAVSQWLKHKAFPRPDKLLRLGKLLSLSFNELVSKQDEHTPIIAFRRAKGTKTKDHHIEKAQDMGCLLRHLVPYLPFETLEMPPVLKSPCCDYAYLQEVAQKVRRDILANPEGTIDFEHLIRHFTKLQAVIIPTLWGSKQRHENAIHIYLPDSKTTWVYLNLDTNILDFKFWMAHELGHCLSPSLNGDEAEDFADAFAGALLFPEYMAEKAYKAVSKKQSNDAKIKNIIVIAEKNIISPYTVYLQINAYAKQHTLPLFALEPAIHAYITRLNKLHETVSQILKIDSQEADTKNYIDASKETFSTAFFDMLTSFLKEHQKGFGYIQTVMDIPLLDAQSLYSELS